MATDQDLDAFFAAARRTGPLPSDDLVQRVLQDAAIHQPEHQPPSAVLRSQPQVARRGWWLGASVGTLAGALLGGFSRGGRFAGGLFGGGAMVGMGTAMLAGLAVGLLQPAPVAAWTTAIFDDQAVSIEMMPTYDALLDEGAVDE